LKQHRRTCRPSAEELLKHAFFSKAKGKEFLVAQLISQLPPLSQRISQKPAAAPAPGSSGRLKKVHNDNGDVSWEWDDDTTGTQSESAVQAELNFKLRYENHSKSRCVDRLHELPDPAVC
jgi:serine/threonine-protein kinase OSR1/STK39